ncbi:hypothetical protein F0919_00495 [Taibaiella lutea]|uniref:Porin n=1 Tax=Taibaiella lutea TaxID=2608001 RepID=A0A5M6CQ94_9BACT|nr:hypothetical protein F0919_00495 [Taibaiella lutea]
MQQLAFISALLISPSLSAQRQMQYYRPNDKTGIRTFETTKNDTTTFEGFKVKVGGNFSQDFQSLKHENNASVIMDAGVNTNQLISLTNGFNLAMANLNIDAQLSDGIRMNLTMYLSARHHEETWVKGGYVQFDKLLFLNSNLINKIMESVTIKIGDYDVDYGDQHFCRSDGGNGIYNPFVENYIMDAFATEIGGEVYFHPKSGFIAMVGVTNGALNPTVVESSKIDANTGKKNTYGPAFHGKIGFDKQVNKDFRLRITGSVYTDKSSSGNTLFWGDRTGSHYFYAMENTAATTDGNAWSGRFNPQFSDQVTSFSINPYLNYKGLELLGTYERVQGRKVTEADNRTVSQYGADIIYRFPANNLFWIGARYNKVIGSIPGNTEDIAITRLVGSVGWFVTKNIMMKAEYVNQKYDHYDASNILSAGRFSGFIAEASIGF